MVSNEPAVDRRVSGGTVRTHTPHTAGTRGGQTRGEGIVQLQVISRLAASPGLPPSGVWQAGPVRGSVPLGAGHVHCSLAGPQEPPTGLEESD